MRSIGRTWTLRAGASRAHSANSRVQARTDLRSPEEFNNMIIKEVSGYPMRLKDVGRAAPGPYENRKIVRVSGEEALGLGIVKQSTANTLAVAQAAKAMLPQMRAMAEAGMPGMKMWVALDTSQFIEASIKSVYETIIMALHPRGAGDLLLPARVSRHADSGHHDPGFDHRSLHLSQGARASPSTR